LTQCCRNTICSICIQLYLLNLYTTISTRFAYIHQIFVMLA
jgi:hypothetical protein